MNDTDRLRDLLHRAVPEAPQVDAGDAARAGRRTRVARGGVAVLVAAACVAAAAVAVPLLRDDDPEPATQPRHEYVDDRTETLDPSGARCPASYPARQPHQLPDLAGATAVRLCVNPALLSLAPVPPDDALVTGLDRFAADVAVSPEADPARCAAAGVGGNPLWMLVESGGRRQLVVVEHCTDVRASDRSIAGEDVQTAFQRALARQRDRYVYPLARPGDLNCDAATTIAPFEPGRDRIVAAVFCGPYDSGTRDVPLTGDDLSRLRAAWATTPPSMETDFEDPEPCTIDDDGQPFLMIRTAIGDVVRLAGTDCDRLVADSTTDDRHWEVPIGIDDLTG